MSDVHSNLEALDAVLEDARRRLNSFGHVVNLGDTVGYGANPDEVINRISSCGPRVDSILGNHDSAVLTGDVLWFNELAAQGVNWTRLHVSNESKRFLAGLPTLIRFNLESISVYAVHGSPWDHLNEYVFPGDALLFAQDFLDVTKADVVLLGHTHVPMIVEVKERDGLIINPGSVGQSRDGIPLASYGVLSCEDGRARFEVFRVEYDFEKAAAKILSAGLPGFFAARLVRGI